MGTLSGGAAGHAASAPILLFQLHPGGEDQDDLPHGPCLAFTSFTHPRHSTSTTAAPSEPGHLTILLLDHYESKPQCLISQAEPSKASLGQSTQLLELPQ